MNDTEEAWFGMTALPFLLTHDYGTMWNQSFWRATNKIVLCIKKFVARRTSALARRARILAAVYSRSVIRFADVLSLLGERLKVLHVL